MQEIANGTLTENRACATFTVTHLDMPFLLFCKNWKAQGKVSVKHLKIRNGVLDIAKETFTLKLMCLMLHFNKAANITVSNEPVQDITISVYIHHSDEIYTWTYRRSKCYNDYIVE